MASDRADVPISSHRDELEQELLSLILSDEASYPWALESQESDAFLTRLEEEAEFELLQDEPAVFEQKMTHFFATLSQAWDPSTPSALETVRSQLVQHFGGRVPHSLLETIAQRAQTLLTSQLPLAEQMVECVQDVLSNWNPEDLFVLARPYANAMRGSDADTLEVALRSVRYAAWTELSGVEQARLSLAIARYTLSQIDRKSVV